MPRWVSVNNESRQRKDRIGVGGCAHQLVLGSQISQGAQVSGIKDVENGIKNIHGVGFLEDSGRCYRHKDTHMHTHIHTPLSNLWSCSATVMANLNPSLTITAVSSEWTEVVLADVMLAGTSRQIREEHTVFPVLLIPLLTKGALYCTVQKRIFFSQLFPLDHFRFVLSHNRGRKEEVDTNRIPTWT